MDATKIAQFNLGVTAQAVQSQTQTPETHSEAMASEWGAKAEMTQTPSQTMAESQIDSQSLMGGLAQDIIVSIFTLILFREK